MIFTSALLTLATVAQSDGRNGYTASRKEAELAMAAFAACEVRTEKGRAAALAFTREVEGSPSKYPKRLKSSACARTGTTMRFKPDLFRMMLFPALYARDYGAVATSIDVSKVPAADYAREFDGEPSLETRAIRTLGDCVVRRDNAATREFVLSRAYSKVETAALARLRPALEACVPGGQQLRFSRSVAHGAIGEALYKLTAASAATKAS